MQVSPEPRVGEWISLALPCPSESRAQPGALRKALLKALVWVGYRPLGLSAWPGVHEHAIPQSVDLLSASGSSLGPLGVTPIRVDSAGEEGRVHLVSSSACAALRVLCREAKQCIPSF